MAKDLGATDRAWAVVEAINRCWLESRVDDLRSYFDPDLAMALPGFSGAAEGAEAIIDSFRDFAENATVERFETADRLVHVARSTAVVVYSFDITYTRAGEAHRSTGRDLWVLSNGPEGWRAVWRTMLDPRDESIGAASS